MKGFAMSLKDCFENNDFNMLYSQIPTEYEIILRKTYGELLKTKT